MDASRIGLLQHLALKSMQSLEQIAECVRRLVSFPPFEFDAENETEWAWAEVDGVEYNVSRPYKAGTLHEWDHTVPPGCNVGIAVIVSKDHPHATHELSLECLVRPLAQQLADALGGGVHYHRTWEGSGRNTVRHMLFTPELSQFLERAHAFWQGGQPLEAGRMLYEQLPNDERPPWAGEVLRLCASTATPDLDSRELMSIVDDPSRWREGHDAFSRIRALTLEAERSDQADALYKAVLYLAENVAKVTYNASGQPAPFDADVGWWVVVNARFVVDRIGLDEFGRNVWATLVHPWTASG